MTSDQPPRAPPPSGLRPSPAQPPALPPPPHHLAERVSPEATVSLRGGAPIPLPPPAPEVQLRADSDRATRQLVAKPPRVDRETQVVPVTVLLPVLRRLEYTGRHLVAAVHFLAGILLGLGICGLIGAALWIIFFRS